MTARIQQGKLSIAKELYDFIENEALTGTGVDSATYWKNFEQVVADLTPKNKELLAKREQLQAQIDEWHRANPATNGKLDQTAYQAFLRDIGYIVPESDDFQVGTTNVDEEIASLAGAQLVVPIRNARYALNAANARWGSLYDALYGTDVISEEDGAEKGKGGYNPVRGNQVIAFAKDFLNKTLALESGSHADATHYAVDGKKLVVTLKDGTTTSLKDASQLVGFNGEASKPNEVQRLAERSAAATKQIEGLVKTIQSDTNEAVISMEQTTSEVVRGANLAKDAGVALEQVQTVSRTLADLIQNISDAARQQAASAGHISNTMNVIQDITTQTTTGTINTAKSVGDLANMAVELRASVADFKLPEEM